MLLLNYAVLERPITKSWLIIKLPFPMTYIQVVDYIDRYYSEWDFVLSSINNPRGSDDWADYDDVLYYLAADIDEIDEDFYDDDDFTSGFEEI